MLTWLDWQFYLKICFLDVSKNTMDVYYGCKYLKKVLYYDDLENLTCSSKRVNYVCHCQRPMMSLTMKSQLGYNSADKKVKS